MKLLSPQSNVAVKRILAAVVASSLLACAVAEVAVEIRFERISAASASSESAAIVGMFYRISEGPLLYNVGVTIISIDDVVVPTWQGVVFPAGKRKIVVNYGGPQSTKSVALTLIARPNHKYLVRAAGSLITEKSLAVWIEDASTREVVVSQRPPAVVSIDATPKGQIAYDRFRTALEAAAN